MSPPQDTARWWWQLGFENRRYWLVFLPYVLLSLLLTLRHQPFGDEAQAWLLARDNTLLGILKLERYEAIPGLWHLLLYLPAHLGMPYITMQLLHWLLNGLAVYVILRGVRGDFRLMSGTIFGYLILYEYGVIARNYVLTLLGLAILAAAWFRPWSMGKHWLYLGFFLTAGSSLFGLCLAVPIAVFLLGKVCQERGWRKTVVPLALLGAIGLLCFLPISPAVCGRFSNEPLASKSARHLLAGEHGASASQALPAPADAKPTVSERPAVTGELAGAAQRPPESVTPRSSRLQGLAQGSRAETSPSHHAVEAIGMAFYWAFSQGGIEWALYGARLPMFPPSWRLCLGLMMFVFAVLFLLRRPPYLALFLAMSGGVLALLMAIPLSPATFRHSGSIFLAFLFCWWLTENDPGPHTGWPQRLRWAAPKFAPWNNTILRAGIALILLLQIIAGAVASYQDYRYPLSQSTNAARYLKAQGLLRNERYVWASYHAIAVLAYFDDVKMYSLNHEAWQSYEIWDAEYFANLKMSGAEIGVRLARLANAHPGKTIMLLANEKLRLAQEPTHSLQLLQSFEPARKVGENFYIYRYR
jgi:hypothetical protein